MMGTLPSTTPDIATHVALEAITDFIQRRVTPGEVSTMLCAPKRTSWESLTPVIAGRWEQARKQMVGLT